MKRALWPSLSLLAIVAFSWLLSAASGMPIWAALVIVAVGVLATGWLATLEDDLPGGMNNPDGADTPPYVTRAGWAIRGLGALLALASVAMLALNHFAQK